MSSGKNLKIQNITDTVLFKMEFSRLPFERNIIAMYSFHYAQKKQQWALELIGINLMSRVHYFYLHIFWNNIVDQFSHWLRLLMRWIVRKNNLVSMYTKSRFLVHMFGSRFTSSFLKLSIWNYWFVIAKTNIWTWIKSLCWIKVNIGIEVLSQYFQNID